MKKKRLNWQQTTNVPGTQSDTIVDSQSDFSRVEHGMSSFAVS